MRKYRAYVFLLLDHMPSVVLSRRRLPWAPLNRIMPRRTCPWLLDDLARGGAVTDMQNGVPVARVLPLESSSTRDVRDAIDAWKAFRERIPSRSGPTISEMIQRGRR